ncbi:MAG TPA: arsenical pump-driving ATPase [Azospirillum sp.]
MDIIETPPRNLFFTGKGGVGKTSVACATAVRLAGPDVPVLLVSTDPASNLDEVFGLRLGGDPTPIPEAEGLWAMNIDPVAAAAAYRERTVGPYRGVLPDAVVASMEEQLSGACTVEIAAFEAFAKLVGDPAATARFGHVIFDTAPTGHTLRLLSLPKAWTGFMTENAGGNSCLGPLEGLAGQRALYEETVRRLCDTAETAVVLVARPETAALAEAARTSGELAALGLANQHLVVNGIFRAADPNDPIAVALEARGRDALEAIPAELSALPVTELSLLAAAPMGVEGLRRLLVVEPGAIPSEPLAEVSAPAAVPGWRPLLDEIAAAGRGLVMTMGKGGVGKTTVAAAVAVELARRGHKVHLTTTDPAAHVADAARQSLPGLTIGRIDPRAEVEAYRAHVMSTAGAGLDDAGRALLEEELRSPCTEEIAVFQAFARTVAQAEDGFVVVDTAPTGHTILLLDAAEVYHREVVRQTSDLPEAVRGLLPRLRNPDFTRILICALPEATPVHEAAALQADLRRAGIEPFAWVLTQCLTPLTVSDPVLRRRQAGETRFIDEVAAEHARRAALLPWDAEVGRAAVEEMA